MWHGFVQCQCSEEFYEWMACLDSMSAPSHSVCLSLSLSLCIYFCRRTGRLLPERRTSPVIGFHHLSCRKEMPRETRNPLPVLVLCIDEFRRLRLGPAQLIDDSRRLDSGSKKKACNLFTGVARFTNLVVLCLCLFLFCGV